MLVGRTIAYAAKIFMKTYFYSVTCEDHLPYFPAHKTHRGFFIRNFRKKWWMYFNF